MTTNKFEWAACLVFLVGLTLAVSSFDLTFIIKASDWLTLIAILIAGFTAWRAYRSHQEMLQPFINSLFVSDASSGTMTFSIENAGGGAAIIKSAYYRFKNPRSGYYGCFPLVEFEHLRNVPQMMQRDSDTNAMVEVLFKKASDTFALFQTVEGQKLSIECDSYYFTHNNAVGKGEVNKMVSFQHKLLRSDTEYPSFARALTAHAKMIELFIEYEDVTGKKHYKPSKGEFLTFKHELNKDYFEEQEHSSEKPSKTMQIELNVVPPQQQSRKI